MAKRRGSSADSLRQRAEAWTRDDLRRVWQAVQRREAVAGWDPGKAFEYLVVRAFQLAGAEVRWPYQVVLKPNLGVVEQIDGAVYLGGVAFLIESKDLSEAAAVEAVSKMRFRLERRPPGVMGLIVSTSDFTRSAELLAQFASPMNVLLWGREDLEAALSSDRPQAMLEGLKCKREGAVEFGLPLFSLQERV